MKRLVWMLILALATLLRAAQPAPDPLEQQVAALVAGPQVTVVHFWAPWCDNSQAEMDPARGWAKFIADHPEVKVVFINIWHKGQNPQPRLAEAGLGAQPNLLLRNHPNRSRLKESRLNSFLGLPLTWNPTTWVYRDGRLRTAFNHGEIRFPVLQQMVEDARSEWHH